MAEHVKLLKHLRKIFPDADCWLNISWCPDVKCYALTLDLDFGQEECCMCSIGLTKKQRQDEAIVWAKFLWCCDELLKSTGRKK